MYLKSQLRLLVYLLERGERRDVVDTCRSLSEDIFRGIRDSLQLSLKNKMLNQCLGDRLVLDYLEMDVVHGCNLNCPGCSHYSNHAHIERVSFQEGKKWLEDWAHKLLPREFRLLGGEPALNPDLTQFVDLAHKLWPESRRAVASNGLVLHLQPDAFFAALGETQTALFITIHSADARYHKALRRDWLERQSMKYGFHIGFGEGLPEKFCHLYRGDGPDMMPFDDNDEWRSWACCSEKFCPTIHQGRLWKCPPLAFLGLMENRFHISANSAWHCALNHKALPPEAGLEAIAAYLNSAEKACNMCPAERHYVPTRVNSQQMQRLSSASHR